MDIYLITQFDAQGKESERLVKAESRSKAIGHVAKLNKASPDDVARVMQTGAEVEEAKE